MKKYLLLILVAATLSACKSTPEPKRDYTQSSIYTGTKTSLDSQDAFTPDPGYTPDIRNRNNFMVLNLHLDPIDARTTPVPAGINAISIKNILQNEFEKSKRFSMLKPSMAKNAGIVLDVDASIIYSEKEGATGKGIAYEVRMAFTGYNAEGVQEFALNVIGGASEYFDKHFTGVYKIEGSVRERLLMHCIDKCFAKVFPDLCRKYPITGNVMSIRDTGSRVIVTVDRDSNDGIKQGMPFIIGYYDEDENQIFVANGSAGAISANGTQILIENWNPQESNAVALCKSKIAMNDKDFIQNMFFVSKYRQSK